jgi:hypothetical protein
MDDVPPDLNKEINHPAFRAGLNLLARTGAGGFQLRCSQDDDPMVWVTLARYRNPQYNNLYVLPGSASSSSNGTEAQEFFFEAACGFTPMQAVMRLCDQILIGSSCAHCQKMVIFQTYNTVDVTLPPKMARADPESCVLAWDDASQQFQPECRRRGY